MKKYVVELTIEERRRLEKLVNRGKVEGYKIQHAQVLLKADQGKYGLAWKDEDIANAFGSHVTAVALSSSDSKRRWLGPSEVQTNASSMVRLRPT